MSYTKILHTIVCPKDKQPMHHIPNEAFYNPRLKISYPIIDEIPILIPEKSEPVTDVELQKRYEQGELTGN